MYKTGTSTLTLYVKYFVLKKNESRFNDLIAQYEKKIAVEAKLKASSSTLIKVHTNPKSKLAAQEEYRVASKRLEMFQTELANTIMESIENYKHMLFFETEQFRQENRVGFGSIPERVLDLRQV